jgi:hypothetical protein
MLAKVSCVRASKQNPHPLRKSLFRIPRCVIIVLTYQWAARVLSEGHYEK